MNPDMSMLWKHCPFTGFLLPKELSKDTYDCIIIYYGWDYPWTPLGVSRCHYSGTGYPLGAVHGLPVLMFQLTTHCMC